jgi:hypothetical protein
MRHVHRDRQHDGSQLAAAPVFGFVPPAMLLCLWNEDRPLLIGPLHRRQKHL